MKKSNGEGRRASNLGQLRMAKLVQESSALGAKKKKKP